MDEPRKRPPFGLSVGSTLVLLALVAAIELWGISATDGDFWFPDPFRPLVLYVVGLWVVTALLPWNAVRWNLRLVFGVVLVGGILVMEVHSRARDVGISGERIEQSDDALLRYQYRPGAVIGDADKSGRTPPVNHLGLWDDEHAIPKPPGVYRIVVLGDSVPNDATLRFVDRFPQRLEAMLRADGPSLAGGRKIEVVNVSCEGYNTIQEERLLERVGLQYQPDLVVVAYVMNDPFLQNGGYRRIGDSFFVFQFLPLFANVEGGFCPAITPLYDRYAFDLAVREPLERLVLLSRLRGFQVALGVLPMIQPYDDPTCLALYDQVVKLATSLGIPAVDIVDEFKGHSPHEFDNARNPGDLFHPNAAGHERYARGLERLVKPILAAVPRAAEAGAPPPPPAK